MSRPIRVVLADDHPVVRAGLRLTLTAEPDIVLAGEATSGDEARRLARELQPDVLLLDLSMPGPPAAETVAYLRERWPALRVLVKPGGKTSPVYASPSAISCSSIRQRSSRIRIGGTLRPR